MKNSEKGSVASGDDWIPPESDASMAADPPVPLLHEGVTKEIIGAFYTVNKELGPGFVESVYSRAMAIELRERGLHVDVERELTVYFRGRVVGTFRADHFVEHLVAVEYKVARAIDPAHQAQLLNCMKASDVEVGFVFNFGARAEFRRFVLDNDTKRSRSIRANPT